MIDLVPFAPVENLRVKANLDFSGGEMVFQFEMSDPDGAVHDGPLPGNCKGAEYTRADGLWKTTCFEGFWGLPGKAPYWELNISPARREWNLYAFADYRTPQLPIPSQDFALKEVSLEPNSLRCVLTPKIKLLRFEASLNAILRTTEVIHYFALKHLSERPDFHNRASFILNRP